MTRRAPGPASFCVRQARQGVNLPVDCGGEQGFCKAQGGQVAPANEDIRASHDACPGDGISGYDGPSQDLEIARR